MRRKTVGFYFAAFFFAGAVLAQVEDIPVKGTVPFELKEHCIIVKGKINGSLRQYDFLLDTGALTFIDKEVAGELDLKTRGNMAKDVMLVVKNKEDQREVSLHKEMLIDRKNP